LSNIKSRSSNPDRFLTEIKEMYKNYESNKKLGIKSIKDQVLDTFKPEIQKEVENYNENIKLWKLNFKQMINNAYFAITEGHKKELEKIIFAII